jgi:hypothetical protein
MFTGRQWLMILLAGGATAFAFMLALTGKVSGMFLSNFTQFPLFLVALSLGTNAVAIAAVLSLVVMLFAGLAVGAPLLLILYAAPTVILARQAMLSRPDGNGNVEWYPPGLLLVWATGIAVTLVTLAFVILASEPEGVEGSLRRILDQLFAKMVPPDQTIARERMVDAILPLLPGFSAALWIFLTLLNGALAQWLLIHAKHNLRPTPDIATARLPRWLTAAFAGAILIGMVAPDSAGYFGRNIALILATPFFFAGMGVLHFLSRLHPAGSLLLTLLYLFLFLFFLFFKWPILAITAIGLVDQWTGLRQRLITGKPD